MKSLYVISFLILFSHYSKGQFACHSSIPLMKDIDVINGVLKHFGEDTVRISNTSDNTKQKIYKDYIFKGFYDFDNENSGKYPMFKIDWIDENSHKIIISFPEKNSFSQVFELIYNHKMEFSVYKKYKKQGEFIIGDYIELNCNNDTITKGEYTIQENINNEIKKSLRSGNWCFYDENGSLVNKIDYSTGASSNRIEERGSLCDVFPWNKIYGHNYYYSFYDVRILSIAYIHQKLENILKLENRIDFDITRWGVNYYYNEMYLHDFSTRPNSVYEKIKPLNFNYKSDSISINYKSNEFDLELGESAKFKFEFKYVIYRENGSSTTVIANNKSIKYFDESNTLKNGRYEEYNCEGILLVKGQYSIFEEVLNDTITTIDLDTYEEKIAIRNGLNPMEKKSGLWYYYDKEGQIEKEIDYDRF